EMREAVTRLLSYFNFTRNPLAPSHWVSVGLRRVVRGEVGISLYYLALIWSHGLFLYLVSAWASVRLYRRGYNRMATGGNLLATGRRQPAGSGHPSRLTPAGRRESWVDRLLYTALVFVHPSTRLLLIKDFRTFRRDPQQWGQILAFSGLMLLYFAN